MRPRSRTLTAVHKEVLDDIVSISFMCCKLSVFENRLPLNCAAKEAFYGTFFDNTLFINYNSSRSNFILQVYPSHISERSMRVQADGRRQQIVLLDPLDVELMEDKLDAIIDCYHKLTTHKISLGFSKPSIFQAKIIKTRAEKAGKA